MSRFLANHTVLLVIFFSYFVYFPITLLRRPIWDGALSRFAMSHSYGLLNKEALDYGFPSQYIHEILLVTFSKLVQSDYYNLYNIAIALSLGGIFQLILTLARKLQIKPQNKRSEILIGFIVITYPPLHTIYTTQNFVWILCILILLAGIIALLHDNPIIKFFGFLLIAYSFQMASLPFVFLPIYWWYCWKFKRKNFVNHVFFSSILSASILILFRELLFPPKNLYIHYNEIAFTKHFIKMTAINVINYSLFTMIFIILILGLNRKIIGLRKESVLKLFNRPDLIFITLIFLGSCFPYVMANKSPKPIDFYDWSWRHAIVLLVPLTLLTLKLRTIEQAPIEAKKFDIQRIIQSLAIAIFVSMASLSNYGHVQSMVYDKMVIELLSDNREFWTKSEIVCFESSVKRINLARFYELNELAWESTGETNWQYYPDSRCNSKNIPSGSLRNSPQLSGMTDIQWKNVYMGGTGNSKWIAIRISGHLNFLDVLSSTFGGDNNSLKIKVSELENGLFRGSDE